MESARINKLERRLEDMEALLGHLRREVTRLSSDLIKVALVAGSATKQSA